MKEALSFEDVLIEPQYSDIESRSEIDISSMLGDTAFKLPIISAPMDTITEDAMVRAIGECGGLGIIHRYNSIDHQVGLVASSSGLGIKRGAAVGVNGDFLERAQALVGAGARVICVDVAHGHHVKVKRALGKLRSVLPSTVHLMAGNVATLDAFNDLSDWGADSVKVGIGGGCFAAGTLVVTEDGEVPIEKIEVGTGVYTHKNHIRKVTKTFTHENKNTFIAVNNIKATPNHEFYVLHKSKVSEVNDDNIHDLAEWVRADELTKDFLLIKQK